MVEVTRVLHHGTTDFESQQADYSLMYIPCLYKPFSNLASVTVSVSQQRIRLLHDGYLDLRST
jgi:hypothetical protein